MHSFLDLWLDFLRIYMQRALDEAEILILVSATLSSWCSNVSEPEFDWKLTSADWIL